MTTESNPLGLFAGAEAHAETELQCPGPKNVISLHRQAQGKLDHIKSNLAELISQQPWLTLFFFYYRCLMRRNGKLNIRMSMYITCGCYKYAYTNCTILHY